MYEGSLASVSSTEDEGQGARWGSNPQPPDPQSGALPLSYWRHKLEQRGWGTGIRTPIDGSKVRGPAIRRSPSNNERLMPNSKAIEH